MDEWSKATNIGAPLNNSKHNAVSGVSQDGSMLLLHNHYYDNDPGLSVSYETAEGWSTPEDIYIPDFYTNSEYHNACLSADGNNIIISCERDDSFGGNDLYVVHKDSSGTWTSPLNIGSAINTAAEESSVFLAADGVTAYFSSDGHEGFGGSDIYMSRRLDNSWTNWSKPLNLGDKINTVNSERYYVIPASGDYVYFSSYNNSVGQSDIFRIGLPLDKRPNPVVLVSGKVINKKTNEPVAAKIYYEDLETGERLGVVNTNPKIGIYKIILPGGRKYAFRAESEGFLPINENVDLELLQDFKKKMKDLEIVPFEKGQSLTINNIFFETGSANLKKESCFELDRLVKHMKDNPNLIIEVSGHTDNVGADDMNMDLSIRRAKAVCNYLNKNGIDRSRLRYFGFGETKPIVPNNSPANRQKNRRVEVKFIEA
jgi:outer membrane protein OmpA-like peptidoglycan-associated protein